MMQSSLSVDVHAARCGGSTTDSVARFPGSGVARSLLSFLGRDRSRTTPLSDLSDHLLQDIGITRADVQALGL